MSITRERDLVDAMVFIIQRVTIGSDIARLAAIVISMDAYLNSRVTTLKKSCIGRERLLDILDFVEEVIDEARAIVLIVEKDVVSAEVGTRLLALQSKICSYDI